MNYYPNCIYCGRFVNPDNANSESKDCYDNWPPGLAETVFFHKSCAEKSSHNSENELGDSSATAKHGD